MNNEKSEAQKRNADFDLLIDRIQEPGTFFPPDISCEYYKPTSDANEENLRDCLTATYWG